MTQNSSERSFPFVYRRLVGLSLLSYAVGNDANRTAFAQGVMQLVSQYKLDGIEFECVFLIF
jgi:hypothetical protein